MANRTVVGLFETSNEGRRAVSDLEKSGFDRATITMIDSRDQEARKAEAAEESDFTTIFQNQQIPGPEAEYFSEGIRRGGTMVAVKAGDLETRRAVDILEKDGALDIDERVTAWKASGWKSSTLAESAASGLTSNALETALESDVQTGRKRNSKVFVW